MKPVQHRKLRGSVVSTKMQKTIVVRVDRQVVHPKYKKMYTVSKRYQVHEPTGSVKLGDLVEIEECRPLSKEKCWRFTRVLKANA